MAFTPTEQQAIRLLRDQWKRVTQQWDELREEHPAEDDLIAVVNTGEKTCMIMPRRQFMKQFNPPSGF